MTAGRPLEFNPDAALDAAMQLFWSRGYGATSMHDLLAGMGIGRSSFYQAFHSKHEVFVRAVDRYRDGLVAELRTQLAGSVSAMALLRGTLRSVADEARGGQPRHGCLVFNSAAEFGQVDAQVAARIAASIEAFTQVFADAVRQAQREGDIPPARDATLLGRHMVASMSGLRTLAKAGAEPRELAELAGLALSALN